MSKADTVRHLLYITVFSYTQSNDTHQISVVIKWHTSDICRNQMTHIRYLSYVAVLSYTQSNDTRQISAVCRGIQLPTIKRHASDICRMSRYSATHNQTTRVTYLPYVAVFSYTQSNDTHQISLTTATDCKYVQLLTTKQHEFCLICRCLYWTGRSRTRSSAIAEIAPIRIRSIWQIWHTELSIYGILYPVTLLNCIRSRLDK